MMIVYKKKLMKNSDIESLVFIAPESDHAFIVTSKKVRIKCVPTLLICIPQEQILLPTQAERSIFGPI